MKKIIVLISLFLSVTASAQNNAAEDTAVKPAITAIGKPDGKKAEMKIGKEGQVNELWTHSRLIHVPTTIVW